MTIKDNKEFNQTMLFGRAAPSGYEKNSVLYFREEMEKIGLNHTVTDSMWNCVMSVGSSLSRTNKTILIEGHIDSCSFLVSHITKNGYIRVIKQGGPDRKCMQGHKFNIQTRSMSVLSAICPKKAIHIETQIDRNKVDDWTDLVLDIGCNTIDDVKSLGVQVGDIVTYSNDYYCYSFGKDGKYVISQTMDDKAAILCLYELGKRLKSIEKALDEKGIRIFLAATSSEETGTRGATNVAMRLQPDYSISIDCTHSVPSELGGVVAAGNDILCGKGVVLCFGPASNRDFMYELQTVAEENSIDYQLQAVGANGTNCNAIQMFGGNCKTALLSYPLQGMHTPVEKVQWTDLDSVVNLISHWIDIL